MKLLTFIAATLITLSAMANHHEEGEEKMGHDKEHQHVKGKSSDHQHDDAHHKPHDHKAHHPEHKEEVKAKKK